MVLSLQLHQVLPEVVVGLLEVLEEVVKLVAVAKVDDLHHLPLPEPVSISLLLLSLRSARLLVSRCILLSGRVPNCPYSRPCKRRARETLRSVTVEVLWR